MDEEPEVFASLSEAAIGQHEMYMSWVNAGFTETQALALLKVVISEMVRGARGC